MPLVYGRNIILDPESLESVLNALTLKLDPSGNLVKSPTGVALDSDIDLDSIDVTTFIRINVSGGQEEVAALFQANSTTQGILIPRMTTGQMNAIVTPPNGLFVYNTSFNKLYWYNGTIWTTFTGLTLAVNGSNAGEVIDLLDTSTITVTNTTGDITFDLVFPLEAPNGVVSAPSFSFSSSLTTGMYSSGVNTLDFSTNGINAIKIDSTQRVGIGKTPLTGFDINSTLGFTPLSTSPISVLDGADVFTNLFPSVSLTSSYIQITSVAANTGAYSSQPTNMLLPKLTGNVRLTLINKTGSSFYLSEATVNTTNGLITLSEDSITNAGTISYATIGAYGTISMIMLLKNNQSIDLQYNVTDNMWYVLSTSLLPSDSNDISWRQEDAELFASIELPVGLNGKLTGATTFDDVVNFIDDHSSDFPGGRVAFVDNTHPNAADDGDLTTPFDTVQAAHDALPSNGIILVTGAGAGGWGTVTTTKNMSIVGLSNNTSYVDVITLAGASGTVLALSNLSMTGNLEINSGVGNVASVLLFNNRHVGEVKFNSCGGNTVLQGKQCYFDEGITFDTTNATALRIDLQMCRFIDTVNGTCRSTLRGTTLNIRDCYFEDGGNVPMLAYHTCTTINMQACHFKRIGFTGPCIDVPTAPTTMNATHCTFLCNGGSSIQHSSAGTLTLNHGGLFSDAASTNTGGGTFTINAIPAFI